MQKESLKVLADKATLARVSTRAHAEGELHENVNRRMQRENRKVSVCTRPRRGLSLAFRRACIHAFSPASLSLERERLREREREREIEIRDEKRSVLPCLSPIFT
jgi:hypothetical protein